MKPENNWNLIQIASLFENTKICGEVRLLMRNASVVISTKRLLKTWAWVLGLIWLESYLVTSRTSPFLFWTTAPLRRLVKYVPFPPVTLNMEAVSSSHTVNYPPHHIVSHPTTPQCKCTGLLKLLQQNHVMSYDHRREKLNVLMDYSWKCWFFVYVECLFSEIQLR